MLASSNLNLLVGIVLNSLIVLFGLGGLML